MEHEGYSATNFDWCSCYRHQKIGPGAGGVRNKRKHRDHPTTSFLRSAKNTEKNPGDLKKICCLSNSNVKLSSNAGVKNFQIHLLEVLPF